MERFLTSWHKKLTDPTKLERAIEVMGIDSVGMKGGHLLCKRRRNDGVSEYIYTYTVVIELDLYSLCNLDLSRLNSSQ